MATLELSRHTYQTLDNPTKTNKASEYDTFGRITANLKATLDQPKTYESLVKAVDDNRRLWATVASSVADPENTFPQDLKAQLFYLFEFTKTQSKRILQKDATVDVLIDINIAVMRGLKQTVSE